MKKLNKYLMLFVAAFALVGCVDDVAETPSMEAQAGDEVQFGLSLPSSRTVYGDEETIIVDGKETKAFPIYWENDDKVLIFSPDCLQGRNGAGYTVTPDSDNPNFASSLTKVEDYGVQWGEAEKASFYSLYPYGMYAMDDVKNPTKVTGVFVNYSQNIEVDGDDIQSDMEDCLLFASKKDVARGSIVELNYEPITTTFMVTLSVDGNSAEDFMIQSIQIQAPTGTYIAGKFNLNLDGTFENWYDDASKSNIVSAAISDVNTGGFHTIAKGETLTIPMFLAPVPNLNTDGWKIIVNTTVGGTPTTFTKTLTAQDITPGLVHMISLPKLSIKAEEIKEWDPATWMVNIPRNVYLSEISIPGTWNSLNPDCQSDTSINGQYAIGIRAFHLDTRWRVDNAPGVAIGSNPSFTGIWGDDPDITELSVANGGDTYKCDGGNLMRKKSALTFAEYLKQITDNVKNDEYMVVFVTFSQNSYNGDRCPSTWYKAVSDACAANGKVIAAQAQNYNITQNSVVGDVLGRVIVVVNLDATVDSATLPADSKCLFTYVPMNLPSNHYDSSTSHTDVLHYSSKSSSGISMYTSHAQISTTNTSAVNCGDRGYSHLLSNRDTLVKSFWDWSKDNYGTTNYAHDKWIYLGLGGYILNSSSGNGTGYDTIENRYGPMIYDRIAAMGNNVPFYPMGIMLMNNKKGSDYTDSNGTDLKYGFADVCKQILLLNNKYRLQYDPTKPEDYINSNLIDQGTGGSGEDGGDEF